jgi:hypothetical protein
MKHEALPEGATVTRWEMLPPPPDTPHGEKFAHGALCPLVGCTEYGCPGADVKKEEP